MAIQFACPSCHQPIEVDDQYAEQQVTCPYCHNVVTAPATSTMQVGAGADAPPPGARPMTPPSPEAPPSTSLPQVPLATGSPAPVGPAGVLTQPIPKNVVGVAGLICGLLAVILYIAASVTLVKHHEDLGGVPGQPLEPAQMQKRIMELAAHLDQHPWLMTIMVCMLGSMAAWMAGLICSIIGLSRRYQRRAPAIAGLVIGLLFTVILCAGPAIR